MIGEAVRRGLPGAASAAQIGRRLRGAYEIDDWGLDPSLVTLSDPLFGLRWDIEVLGADHLPTVGGAVLVFNRRLGVSEPWVLARGIRQASGRYVRTVGMPDVAPVGSILRRYGAVLDRTDEIAGLLRAGQLVGLPMGHSVRSRERVGRLTVERLDAAIDTESPVIPVAMVGREIGRSWRIVVGAPVAPHRRGGPLAAVELAEQVQARAQDLLDESLPSSWWL